MHASSKSVFLKSILILALFSALGACAPKSSIDEDTSGSSGGAEESTDNTERSLLHSWKYCMSEGGMSALMHFNFTDTKLILSQFVYGNSSCTGSPAPIDGQGESRNIFDGSDGYAVKMSLPYTKLSFETPEGFHALFLNVDGNSPLTFYVTDDGQSLSFANGEEPESETTPTSWIDWVSTYNLSSFVANPIGEVALSITTDSAPTVSNEITELGSNLTPITGARSLTGIWNRCKVADGGSYQTTVKIESDGSFISRRQSFMSADCTGETLYSVLSHGSFTVANLGQPAGFFAAISGESTDDQENQTLYIAADGSEICRPTSENFTYPETTPADWDTWVTAGDVSSFVSDPTAGDCFDRVQ